MTKTHTLVAAEISDAVSRILETDAQLAAGYSKVKARAIAQYALLIGEARASGELSEDDYGAEVAELDRMAARFVRNIRALAHTSAERLILSVAGILRGVAGLSPNSHGVVPPELRLPKL